MQNKAFFTPGPGWLSAALVVLAVAVLAVAGLLHATPPAAMPASASPGIFSADRALAQLRKFAQKAHPTGTRENEAVRNYLLGTLRSLGLKPQVQTALGASRSDLGAVVGVVNNILVRVPGRMHGKALMLAAHYDSVPSGPGAADDGASVAAILETLRALSQSAPLRNDVIAVFTDGEEADMLGADAFVSVHPWARDVGLVLNFEYRGNRGPYLMFETSRGNGRLIEAFSRAAPHPIGNSAMYEVYKRMPNDTDLSVFMRAGIPGMNFAAIDGAMSYHSQLDRPELLQEATLQHEGETMLALVRYFGNTPLEALGSTDKVYFDAPGVGLIRYPVGWVWPLSGLLFLLFCGVFAWGMKSGALRPVRTASGGLAFLVSIPALAGICQLLWLAIRKIHPDYHQALPWDTYNSHWYLLAFIMLAIGLFSLMQARMRKWLHPMELAMGALACWLLALFISSIWFPGASFIFSWPMASTLLAYAVLLGMRARNVSPLGHATVLLLGAAPGILLLTPLIGMMYTGLSPQFVGAVMPLPVMLLGLCVPLVEIASSRMLLPRLSLALAAAFLATGSLSSNFDVRHPRPDNVDYAFDGATGKALWLSFDNRLDRWTQTFFPGIAERRRVPEIFGSEKFSVWAAPVPALPMPAPDIRVLADKTGAAVRKVTLQIRSPRQAPMLALSIDQAVVIEAKVAGKTFPNTSPDNWRMYCIGFPADGIRLELSVKAGQPFEIRVLDQETGLPQMGLRARPPGMMEAPGSGDRTMAVNSVKFR